MIDPIWWTKIKKHFYLKINLFKNKIIILFKNKNK